MENNKTKQRRDRAERVERDLQTFATGVLQELDDLRHAFQMFRLATSLRVRKLQKQIARMKK